MKKKELRSAIMAAQGRLSTLNQQIELHSIAIDTNMQRCVELEQAQGTLTKSRDAEAAKLKAMLDALWQKEMGR